MPDDAGPRAGQQIVAVDDIAARETVIVQAKDADDPGLYGLGVAQFGDQQGTIAVIGAPR